MISWKLPATASGARAAPSPPRGRAASPPKGRGAGDVIYGGGSPGAEEQARPSIARRGGGTAPKESGVGEALWGGTVSARERFETVAQETARRGLGRDARAGPPARSGAPDLGLLRQSIYSAVRQLDVGAITARAFRALLESRDVPVTPAVEKLLMDYTSTGRADFTKFVRGERG